MKKLLSTLLLALVVMTGWAKESVTVWEQPATEYGTTYGDGFFNLVLDVTKVELKDSETVVYITAYQRPDSEQYDYWFQFAGDTYLKVGEQRFTLVSADNIELSLCACENEGLTNDELECLKTEIIVNVSVIDCNLAGTLIKSYSCNRAFSSACAVKIWCLIVHNILPPPLLL